MSAPADQSVRSQALDPERSFIVRAPAGSGKTGLLIQRYLALLARVDEPEEVVAITFTNKAANEMRNRVLAALAADAPADSDYERATADFAQAVRERDLARGWGLSSQPSRLRIQTIDALCLYLVRQMAWLSGTGGDICPLEDAHDLLRHTARNVFAHLYGAHESWAAVVRRALEFMDNDVPRFERLLMSMLERRDQWLAHVMSLESGSSEHRDRLHSALERMVTDELDAVRQQLGPALVQEAQHLAQASGRLSDDDRLSGCDGAVVSAWAAVAAMLLTNDGSPRRQFTKREGFPVDAPDLKARAQRLTGGVAAVAGLADRLHALRDLPAPCFNADQWARLDALVDLLRLAVAELWVAFGERAEVDFIELLARAQMALGEPESPTDLALSLDYRISHILVDEFQDTSSTQIRLLEGLTAGWQPDDRRTLLLVGDPMQSIYRFREADVRLYLQVRDHGLGALTPVALNLSSNFRSRPAVIDWVNEVFARLLPERDDVASGVVAYSASEAQRPGSDGTGAVLHCLVDDDGSEEADLVATLVEDTLRRDPDASIAVLVRARSHLSHILDALRRYDIAYRGVDLDPLREVSVVQDLFALTRALAYPADRIAWLSVLRAPWCGLTLRDLTILGRLPRDALILDALCEARVVDAFTPDGRRRAAGVRDVLRAALAQRGRCSWRTLVEQSWLALGGPALAPADQRDDAQRYLALVEQWQQSDETHDFAELLRAVNGHYSSPLAKDSRVQVMTLHSAKGLEFDHVVLPALERRPRQELQNVLEWATRPLEDGNIDLLLAPIHAVGDDAEAIYRWLRRLEADKVRNEATRLLYVACTRARERLHLIGNVKRGKHGLGAPSRDSLLAQLWPVVESRFEAEAQARGDGAAGGSVGGGSVGAVEAPGLRRVPLEWASPVKPVYREPHAAGRVDEPVEFVWAGASARHVGTVVHQMLCSMSRVGLSAWSAERLQHGRSHWRGVLSSLGVPQREIDAAVDRVHDTLASVLTDERGRWLLSTDHLESASELPLSGFVDGRLVNAILDRTFVDEVGTRWIVDYKTGAHAGGDLDAFLNREQERYSLQLERYATLMAGLDQRAIRLGLYFPLHRGWRAWRPVNAAVSGLAPA